MAQKVHDILYNTTMITRGGIMSEKLRDFIEKIRRALGGAPVAGTA